MTTWCSNVYCTKDLRESEYENSYILPNFNDANIGVILHDWLIYISKMALQYAYIAYGNDSFETKVFKDILEIWINPTTCNEPNSVKDNFNSFSVDYKTSHRLTRDYISLLC